MSSNMSRLTVAASPHDRASAALTDAVEWIKEHDPHLARLARHLESLSLSDDVRDAYGWFDVREGHPRIGINERRCGDDPAKYVYVLAHELTHLRQWVEHRPRTEPECERAGLAAVGQYRAQTRSTKAPRPQPRVDGHFTYDHDLWIYRHNAAINRRVMELYRLQERGR